MKVFKEHLIDKVNPDLLQRLWIKCGMPGVLIYKSEYGFKIEMTATPFGILQKAVVKWNNTTALFKF